MAGATARGDYHGDDGTLYTTKYPSWLIALFTDFTATSTTTLPRGLKKRRRYARVTASGKEHSFPVWSATDPLYSDAYGTAVTTEIGVTPAATGFPSTLQGRSGEKTRNI